MTPKSAVPPLPVGVSSEPSAPGATQQQPNNHQPQSAESFQIGYNIGIQSVHMETLRTKLDDNLELFKSHFHSLREQSKTNFDGMRRLHLEYNKQFAAELEDGIHKLHAKLEAVEAQLAREQKSGSDLAKQQFDSLQKHFDDRMENIKDTVKVAVLVLACLQIAVLFTINNSNNQQLESERRRAEQQQQQQKDWGESRQAGGRAWWHLR
jgi:hypothetical protein